MKFHRDHKIPEKAGMLITWNSSEHMTNNFQGRSKYKPNADCQIENLEAIYKTKFKGKEQGIFVEIGAYDGCTVSNTSFLADAGWKGFYFEPVQEYALACQARHIGNNVKTLPCGVSANGEPLTISVGGVLTSARADHVEQFKSIEWAKYHHQGLLRSVPCIKSKDVVMLTGTDVDLLVIDVEGMEPEIISNWDFSACVPSLLIVESRDRDLQFSESIRQEYTQMIDYLAAQGYGVIQHDGCNIIFSQ